jgi:hypothetical protein
MFSPNYGAASSHIQTLMAEREDFLAVNRTQAAKIKKLEEVTDDAHKRLLQVMQSADCAPHVSFADGENGDGRAGRGSGGESRLRSPGGNLGRNK